MTIATTETGTSLDRGLALHEAGAVEMLGGTLVLVEDGGMDFADLLRAEDRAGRGNAESGGDR